MLRRVMSLFSIFCRKFFVSVPKNFVGEPFCAVFQKISGSEKFMDKTGGGEYQGLPSKVFCFTEPKISAGESFTVALISGIEKVWIRGGDQDFPSKIFCLTLPKNFVKEPSTKTLFSPSYFLIFPTLKIF